MRTLLSNENPEPRRGFLQDTKGEQRHQFRVSILLQHLCFCTSPSKQGLSRFLTVNFCLQKHWMEANRPMCHQYTLCW